MHTPGITPNQTLYAICILCMFLLFGSSVRKGVFRGPAILWAGALTGLLAMAVSIFIEIPDYRAGASLGLLAVNPVIMAALTVFCVTISYRQQRTREVGSLVVGDTKFIVLACPPILIPDADALILPGNTALRLNDTMGRIIAGAAGAEAQAELTKLGTVKPGKVVSIGSGNLAVGRIFYAAVGESGKRVDAASLRRGVESAAQQARKANAESLAIPLGPQFGLTMAEGFEAVITGALNQRKAFAEIVFLVFEPRTAGLAHTVVQKVLTAEPTRNLSATRSG
jgi:hypothetical protein